MGAVESVHSINDHSGIQAFHTNREWTNHFESLKGTCKLMVVDFTAEWCGPCKSMESVLAELAAKYPDVVFVKIDVDELMDVANEYSVQSLPMFVLFKEGKQVDKLVGADKGGLERKILKHRV